MPENRSILFIDGNNWYHGLKKAQVDSGWLDYHRVAEKLLIDRKLQEIRYYIGRVSGNRSKIADQDRFLKRLESQGVRIILGRVERNWMGPDDNPIVYQLKHILASGKPDILGCIFESLDRLCGESVPYYVEKQVDVRIAVDLVSKAHRNEYDTAYLLSADGDFVPAVEEVKYLGKKVFAASIQPGKQLADAVDVFIPLKKSWFDGLNLQTIAQSRKHTGLSAC